MFKVRWQKIYKRILKRQAPHAILSWRYFMPNQSHAVRLHRRTFLNAWPQYPRAVWFLIALYSYSLWYLFYGWWQLVRIWCNRSLKIWETEGIPKTKQLIHLLILTYLHSTPPRFYYQYRLYYYPEREWLNFIYTHELPHWHLTMSPNISLRSQQLMTHKHDFSTELARLGLPTIPTLYKLNKGESLTSTQIFCQQSLFFKPEQGSRKEGCFELNYDVKKKIYQLRGFSVEKNGVPNKIISTIQQINTQDYIVQVLLKNHPQLKLHSQYSQLITIRLITAVNENQPKIISSVLEIPIIGSFNRVYIMNIDIESGKLESMFEDKYSERSECLSSIKTLIGTTLPDWKKIVLTAEHAHKQFMDISTIGWDLAITNHDIVILEGNINWGVEMHQNHGKNLLTNIIKSNILNSIS